jgi:aerobic-type carbon monoxide dehydrogenase small subunit (CoxS/CutS family)
MTPQRSIQLRVNGQAYARTMEVRPTLVAFLREELQFMGMHPGGEHGMCGPCTIPFNGESERSCLLPAIQADGAELMAIDDFGIGVTPVQCGSCVSARVGEPVASPQVVPEVTLARRENMSAPV